MCQFSNAIATFLAKIVEKVNAEPTVFINNKGFKPLVKKPLRKKQYKNFLQDRIEAELTLF